MKKSPLILLAAICIAACSIQSTKAEPQYEDEESLTPVMEIQPATATIPPIMLSEPPLVTKKYFPTDEDIQNPERGFAADFEFDDPDFYQYYEQGDNLVYGTIRLDDYRETELPQAFIDGLDAWFSLVRKGGIKVILRFAYNDGPYPFPEPDASLEQILLHIAELKPVLQRNADVIVWMEAGFIGAWGEWHSSTNGLDKNVEEKKEVLLALLDALPADRKVLLRYPVDIITNYPTPLAKETAFGEDNQARVGFHNDCFLAEDNDEHTYARDGINNYDDEMDYLSITTKYVPVGGETCYYNPPRSDCPTALEEMRLLHFTEISNGWHPDVLLSWKDQDCYDEIKEYLGYRFSLMEATMNESVRPGGVLSIEFKIRNEGFASLVNLRYVYLVLDGPQQFKVKLPIDPRFWMPGELSSFFSRIRMPMTAPEGKYQIAIWLPDPYPSLQDDVRYSVRIANAEVWDPKTAYNILGEIEVNSSVLGSFDPAANTFDIIK